MSEIPDYYRLEMAKVTATLLMQLRALRAQEAAEQARSRYLDVYERIMSGRPSWALAMEENIRRAWGLPR